MLTEIKKQFSNNSKIVENYFFMTSLQFFSSLLGIIVYPYIIRKLGASSYGLYTFALSVTSYFIVFISFGFNYPSLKAIVQNKDDINSKSTIVSIVFTAKLLLALISSIIFIILLFSTPIMRANPIIFVLAFTQIIAELFFPIWYFQGIQKMKVVTFIQLGFRILSLPFIFIFVNKTSDNQIFMLITSSTIILGSIVAYLYLTINEDIVIRLTSLESVKKHIKEALPFFWSNSTGIIKQESVTILIGIFFGMRDVAYYDLANKIIILPRMLTTSINSAIFPKIMENANKSVIRRIIKYEIGIGLSITAAISIFGYWIVIMLGGENMLISYPLAIILSVTVLVWLVVGSYINFIFVPNNKYYFVTQNQLIAFASFFVFCIPGILLFHTITIVVLSLTLSGLCEVFYCYYLIKRHKLL